MKRQITVSILLTVLTFGFVGVVQADLSDGLVAYYPFNGNANDESGNGNEAIAEGVRLTSNRKNEPNSAYSFDGNGKIKLPDNLRLTGNQTFAMWINPDPESFGRRTELFGGCHACGYGGFGVSCGWADGDRPEHFQCKAFDGHTSPYACATAPNWGGFEPNSWNFLAVTYSISESTIRIFLNGQQMEYFDNFPSIADFTYINWGSKSLCLGDASQSSYDLFVGKMDDVRIYNRVLSESEIQRLYNENDCDCPDGCTQAELDAKYTEGYNDGVATCEGCTQTQLDEKYEEGKQYCIDYPEKCGIDAVGKYTQDDLDEKYDKGYQAGLDVHCDDSPITPDNNCATFNLFTNTLSIPCLEMGKIYWVDMKLEGDHLTIDGFGEAN